MSHRRSFKKKGEHCAAQGGWGGGTNISLTDFLANPNKETWAFFSFPKLLPLILGFQWFCLDFWAVLAPSAYLGYFKWNPDECQRWLLSSRSSLLSVTHWSWGKKPPLPDLKYVKTCQVSLLWHFLYWLLRPGKPVGVLECWRASQDVSLHPWLAARGEVPTATLSTCPDNNLLNPPSPHLYIIHHNCFFSYTC